MIYFLTMGTVLGLSAGFAPGPLMTLVISETLQYDIKSGIRVALAPIITDLPVILLILLVLSKLSHFHNILGVVSLAGGCFILVMAYQSIRAKEVNINIQESEPRSLMKGVAANALNPHPYLFWFTVGAPTMTKALSLNTGALAAFIAGFYACLVGSKILLAVLTGKSKSFLGGRGYVYVMRFLGMVLGALACVLFYDGLNLLGVVIKPQ